MEEGCSSSLGVWSAVWDEGVPRHCLWDAVGRWVCVGMCAGSATCSCSHFAGSAKKRLLLGLVGQSKSAAGLCSSPLGFSSLCPSPIMIGWEVCGLGYLS